MSPEQASGSSCFRCHVFALAAALILLAACAKTLTGRRQLKLASDEQMAAMGVATFEELKKNGETVDTPDVTEYVRCIADSILSVLPEDDTVPDHRWEVVVFEDPTPNAFALPGGKIGVHTGMLSLATTPAQLASVMGHEVAHVLLHHGNERVSQTVVVTVWRKMEQLGGDQPPEFLSTHPSHGTRIEDLDEGLSETMPLYRAARMAGRDPSCRAPS